MTFTAATYADAKALADDLCRIHAGLDWVVTIHPPPFCGDLYRVTVGI